MLVFFLFSFLLIIPALQGVWDFRAQFLSLAALFLAGGFWIFREFLAERPPEFLRDKNNLPLLLALLFSLISAVLSPVRPLVEAEWWVFAAGIFILVLAGELKRADRTRVDAALRFAAWFVLLLSLYQAFVLKSSEISASFNNPNTLALYVLMMLPLAIMWKDMLLMAGLIIVLVWTQSSAALLALLAGIGFYVKDNMRTEDLKKNWPLLSALAVIAAVAISQLEPGSFFDRLGWWRAALNMFIDRPGPGFGPGSFAYVYPAYHIPQAGGLSTVYVHNYYIEFLAENGIFAFMFWFWAVASRLGRLKDFRKYAVIAALAHSLADFGLAVPANLFVFCYLLSEPEPSAAPAGVPQTAPCPRTGTVVVLAALCLACFAALCGVFNTQLKLERSRADALKAFSAGDIVLAEEFLKTASDLAPRNPLVPALAGRVRLQAGLEKKNMAMLFSAAAELERAVAMSPYNAGAWRDLERLYGEVGERKLLADLLKRKAEVFK